MFRTKAIEQGHGKEGMGDKVPLCGGTVSARPRDEQEHQVEVEEVGLMQNGVFKKGTWTMRKSSPLWKSLKCASGRWGA